MPFTRQPPQVFKFSTTFLAAILVKLDYIPMFLLASLAVLELQAQTNLPSLTREHVDLLLTYNSSANPPLALTVRDDDHGVSYSSNEVVLVATEASKFTLPFDVPELGLATDQTIWWLRQTMPPANTLFLGFAGAGIPNGTFTGPLSVYVTNVVGPGGFIIWQDTPLGGIDLKVDSRNGLSAVDMVPVFTSGHDHFNWAFTTSGVYCVTFRVDGVPAGGGGIVSSGETTVVFHVRPLGVVTPFALWQKAHWLQGTDPSTNGPAADPDGDGLINAIEYASNLDPKLFSTNGGPTFTFVTNSLEKFGALSFTCVKGATDLNYQPSVRTHLNFGAWEILSTVAGVTDNGDTETVTMRDQVPLSAAPARFYQFQVQLFYP
jgi:surface-anchored protein